MSSARTATIAIPTASLAVSANGRARGTEGGKVKVDPGKGAETYRVYRREVSTSGCGRGVNERLRARCQRAAAGEVSTSGCGRGVNERLRAARKHTHPLVFYAANAVKRLGRKARHAFEAFEAGKATLYVPAPVVLETWMLARAGKLKLRTTLGAWWRDLESAGLVYEPLDGSDVIAASELD
jgi:hypothetical protein